MNTPKERKYVHYRSYNSKKKIAIKKIMNTTTVMFEGKVPRVCVV